MEYHEFLAYLFDFPQTRDLATGIAAAAASRKAAEAAAVNEKVLVDA